MARRRNGTAPAPTRVVLYVRVSALMGRAGDTFHSPDMQRAALERHVEPLGMAVVDTIEDIDVTGQTFSRAGLDQLRELVEDRQVDAVGLYDLSRLGRNVMESLTFIAWLQERGVTVLSTKEQIDDTPTGQFMLTQFLAMAQLQGDQIGQRWAEIVERRAGRGLHHGTAPLGYRWVDKRMVPDGVVGTAVTEVFERYADGWAVTEILAAFSRSRGQRTARRTLKGMLSNPVYLGKVTLHGQLYDGLHDALVDGHTWDLVAARLERDRSTPSRALEVTHALSGLLVCDTCDAKLGRENPMIRSHGRRIQRVYCRRATSGDGAWRCTGIGTPRYEPVEAEVLRQTCAYLEKLKSSHAARVAARARKAAAGSDERVLRRQLEKTKEALGRLALSLAKEQITDAEHAAAVKDLRGEERALGARLAEARSVVAAPQPAEAAVAVETLGLLWPKASAPERNLMLRKVVRQVRVSPGVAGEVGDRVEVRFWGE